MLLQRLNSRSLIKPKVHHDTLDQHIFVVCGLGVSHLLDVKSIDLVEKLAHAFQML
jgi:hypothetical protein